MEQIEVSKPSSDYRRGAEAAMSDSLPAITLALSSGVVSSQKSGFAEGDAGGSIGFTDNGGAIIPIVRVQLIFWGNAWGTTPPPTPSANDITNAVVKIFSSGYMTGLAQYRNIGIGFLNGTTVVTSSNPPNPFSDTNVSNFIAGLIQAGTVPGVDSDNQILYCVIMPKGVNSTGGFIGEHTYYTANNQRVHFSWVENNGTLNSVTTIFSHELVESCTDPEGSAILGNAGTCSQGGWCEIGDVCTGNTGVVNGIAVQSYWSQQANACVIPAFPSMTFPYCAVQFRGTLPANSTQRWFTYNWPAYEHVIWTVVPTTPKPGAPEISWYVQVERASGAYITYWIVITNLTTAPVDIEARYCIVGR